MAGRRLRIFFHDRCFDGAASAAYFWEFYRSRIDPEASLSLRGMAHRRGDPFEDVDLSADDNACVDFRYCADPRMTWWFDHHASAFQHPVDRSHFEADAGGQKYFDPTAPSCAGFLARVLDSDRDFRPEDPEGHWSELIRWAEIIDSARFPCAAEALDLDQPALGISTWLRENRDEQRSEQLIELLGRESLESLARRPWIADEIARFRLQRDQQAEILRARARIDRGVVTYDLADDEVSAPSSFAAYALFPEAVYTVGITRTDEVCKVSVGYNPWAPTPREHSIAELCERYGGGGHPVVGAVSLEPEEIETARKIAADIAAVLRGS